MKAERSGIILYACPIFEKDKRIELFTKDFGKLSCIAKYAQSRRSCLVLDPGCYIAAQCYIGRSCSIFQADLKEGFAYTRQHFNTISMSLYLLNLIRFSTDYEQENPDLFDLLFNCLSLINAGHCIGEVKLFFEKEFLKIEGLSNQDAFHTAFEDYTGSKVPQLLLI